MNKQPGILCLLLFLFLACAGPSDDSAADDGSPAVEVVDIAPAPGQVLVVDLRRTDVAWRLRAGVDRTLVDVICPNGASMGLAPWLVDQRGSAGFDVAEYRGDLVFGPSELAVEIRSVVAPAPEDELPEGCVQPDCYLCTDGAWVCPAKQCSSDPATSTGQTHTTGGSNGADASPPAEASGDTPSATSTPASTSGVTSGSSSMSGGSLSGGQGSPSGGGGLSP